jgi:hypothetical protein
VLPAPGRSVFRFLRNWNCRAKKKQARCLLKRPLSSMAGAPWPADPLTRGTGPLGSGRGRTWLRPRRGTAAELRPQSQWTQVQPSLPVRLGPARAPPGLSARSQCSSVSEIPFPSLWVPLRPLVQVTVPWPTQTTSAPSRHPALHPNLRTTVLARYRRAVGEREYSVPLRAQPSEVPLLHSPLRKVLH